MMRRKTALLMVLCMVLSIPLMGCTIGDTEYIWEFGFGEEKNNVFTINGIPCSEVEARLYLCNYQNLYGKEYGMNLWDHDFGPMNKDETLESYVKDITLAQLANILCMSLLAEERGIVLTETEKKQVVRLSEQYYQSLSEAEIAYIGLDMDQLITFYEKYAVAEKLYETLTEGVDEEVSDDEARVIRVHRIYVTDKAVAQEVQTKLQEGGDFQGLASNYNEANTIETTVKRGDYPKETESVLFRLDNGEQTELLTLEEGYCFFYCVSKYEGEMTELNKIAIIAQRRKEQFEDIFNEFVVASYYKLNEEVWDSVKPDLSGSITTDSFFRRYKENMD